MRWVLVAAAYLIGCIPFGVIVARYYKVNLREQGSGNIGATNALRVMGRKAGIITLLGDMLKGSAAVYIAMRFGGYETALIAAAAAVIGHDFTVFTGFKGGKGVATSAGALFALTAVGGLIGVAVWLAVFWLTRYVSVASITAALVLPVAIFVMSWRSESTRTIFYFSVCTAAVVVWRHRSNLARLMQGTEPRFTRK